MFVLSLLRLIAACVFFSFVAGCASLPPGADQPRESSVALARPEETALGKAFAARMAQHSSVSGLRLLPAGTDGFILRAEMAASAQRTIDVQYFIFHSDDTGKLLLDELLRAADRGVRVRVLLDDLHVAGKDATITAIAAHPNVQLRLFNPTFSRGALSPMRVIELALDWNRLTYRMHNKLFVVDNTIALAGGRNVGDEYFSISKDFDFGDFDVFTVGPAVRRLSASFDAYWNSRLAIPVQALAPTATPEAFERYRAGLREHRERLADLEYMRKVAAGDPLARIVSGADPLTWAPTQVLYDSPEKEKVENGELDGRLLRSRLEQAIAGVRRELLIVTPYVVPGPKQMQQLRQLREQNVRVRILTNSLGSTDVPAVHAGYRKYRVPLLEMGVELFEVRTQLGAPTVRGARLKGDEAEEFALHAKVYMFDRSTVFIGSANFDHRSFRLNTEVGVLIESAEIAQQVARRFEAITQPANSYQVRLDRTQDGKPTLTWHTEEDGKPVVYRREPGDELLRRIAVNLLSLLPIDDQL